MPGTRYILKILVSINWLNWRSAWWSIRYPCCVRQFFRKHQHLLLSKFLLMFFFFLCGNLSTSCISWWLFSNHVFELMCLCSCRLRSIVDVMCGTIKHAISLPQHVMTNVDSCFDAFYEIRTIFKFMSKRKILLFKRWTVYLVSINVCDFLFNGMHAGFFISIKEMLLNV